MASIASSLPERIPSFKTDVESVSSALTHDRLAAHDGRGPLDSRGPAPGGLGVTSVLGARRACDSWQEGSIVEVYSASAGEWYAAEVSQVESQANSKEDIITVIFYMGDQIKQKSVYRSDQVLAPLGDHVDLPPGFETRASQSKPGQLVYFDCTTCTKYASMELAWQVHFERLKQQPGGCETVACVSRRPAPIAETPTPLKGMSIAEEEVLSPLEMAVPPGKVALPAFGDELGSQGAYLDYVGAPLAAAAGYGKEQGNPMAAGYQVVRASAPQRPVKIRNLDPALQKWQDDAFSEWRR
ncbi:unnamed protein product [Effrenium voratum]|nr:unnamed protein product [Effrenium voratum]